MHAPEWPWEEVEVDGLKTLYFAGMFDFMTETGHVVRPFTGFARLVQIGTAWRLDYRIPLYGEWRLGKASSLEDAKKLLERRIADLGFSLVERHPLKPEYVLPYVICPAAVLANQAAEAPRHRRVVG